jgi:DNA invertase Pin-like site-specific DNA recombinase
MGITKQRRDLRRFVVRKKIVAYYRVSTSKQERSGLGLDAQRHDVEKLARREGCEIIGTYTEAESARKDSLQNRPELSKAIAHARAANATLVIAKLDRLSRNVYMTQLLKRTGVHFTCCDMPDANSLTIDVIAAVNEEESKRISERTRAAMAAAKRQGRTFGTPANLSDEAARRGRLLGAHAARRKALAAYEHVTPVVAELHAAGASYGKIAAELNSRGYVTRRDRPWTPVQVARVLSRTLSEVA